MGGLIIFGYGFALTMICLYSLIQLNLVRQYRKKTLTSSITKKAIVIINVICCRQVGAQIRASNIMDNLNIEQDHKSAHAFSYRTLYHGADEYALLLF